MSGQIFLREAVASPLRSHLSDDVVTMIIELVWYPVRLSWKNSDFKIDVLIADQKTTHQDLLDFCKITRPESIGLAKRPRDYTTVYKTAFTRQKFYTEKTVKERTFARDWNPNIFYEIPNEFFNEPLFPKQIKPRKTQRSILARILTTLQAQLDLAQQEQENEPEVPNLFDDDYSSSSDDGVPLFDDDDDDILANGPMANEPEADMADFQEPNLQPLPFGPPAFGPHLPFAQLPHNIPPPTGPAPPIGPQLPFGPPPAMNNVDHPAQGNQGNLPVVLLQIGGAAEGQAIGLAVVPLNILPTPSDFEEANQLKKEEPEQAPEAVYERNIKNRIEIIEEKWTPETNRPPEVGQIIDAIDLDGKWYTAMPVSRGKKDIELHYFNWSQRCNENVKIDQWKEWASYEHRDARFYWPCKGAQALVTVLYF